MSVPKITPGEGPGWKKVLTTHKRSLRLSLRGIEPRSTGYAGRVANAARKEVENALKMATGLEEIRLGVLSQFETWATKELGWQQHHDKWQKIAARLMKRKGVDGELLSPLQQSNLLRWHHRQFARKYYV